MNFIGFSKRFQGRKAISRMMLKMRSAGISKKLEMKWVKNNDLPELSRITEVNQITFAHVKGLLLIHLCMIGASLGLLLLEICASKVYPKWVNRDEKRRIKPPITVVGIKSFTYGGSDLVL
ncbi:hypothetical protein HUJ04_006423 [Dendroctonus ponderosae]|uniref:Uncharacterized protein n=1 Tax=Dendroctonus ponderosae TaxID=77166 RepID=A0AAR5QHS3_DENPD|nr:hypothetical protein HUJ04_006423 [Dendroctonus ponderosae]